ncbi:hypothetical protein DFH06DRAFT_1187462 [Mycena polygramma]|nr:hypothetical protein DFH06DRAFT_1187462 [Mycena polygramma]
MEEVVAASSVEVAVVSVATDLVVSTVELASAVELIIHLLSADDEVVSFEPDPPAAAEFEEGAEEWRNVPLSPLPEAASDFDASGAVSVGDDEGEATGGSFAFICPSASPCVATDGGADMSSALQHTPFAVSGTRSPLEEEEKKEKKGRDAARAPEWMDLLESEKEPCGRGAR